MLRSNFPRGLIFWLVLATPIALVARVSQPIPDAWVHSPLWLRPLVAADALAFYLYKLVFPITLLPDYNRSPMRVRHTYEVYYTWILTAIVTWLLVRYCQRDRRRTLLAAGAIWFIAALLPVLGFTLFAYQHMSTAADRYLYLPMFGVALCAAWALDRMETHGKKLIRRGVIAFSIIVLLALGVRTFFQVQYWRNTFTLFDHSIQAIGRTPGAVEGQPWQ